MSGAKDAVLAHSQSFNVKRIAINGRDVGEIGQVAAIAGHFGIPVIMLAGDQAACQELLDLQPTAVTVAVKRLAGKASTLSLSHAEAKRQIEEAARRAVAQVADYRPWKIAGPIEMTFEFLSQPTQPTRFSTYRQAGDTKARERLELFRRNLTAFVRAYDFLSQIVDYGTDTALEKRGISSGTWHRCSTFPRRSSRSTSPGSC
jgi:hypothetical protein